MNQVKFYQVLEQVDGNKVIVKDVPADVVAVRTEINMDGDVKIGVTVTWPSRRHTGGSVGWSTEEFDFMLQGQSYRKQLSDYCDGNEWLLARKLLKKRYPEISLYEPEKEE